MKTRPWRRIGRVLMGLAGVVVLAIISLYAISTYRLNRRHDVPPLPKLTLSSDPETLARGGHIATSFGLCTQCHGDDLGGKLYLDGGALGVVYGPNLTRGRGGIGGILTEDDWIKAIRYGIGHDGTSLLVMPSEKLAYLAEDDLAALVAYLKQLAPVNRQVPPSELRFLGRILLGAGKLPLLAAEKVPNLPHLLSIDRTPSVNYGLYIANVSSCRGCHRANLSGGSMQAPGSPPASNLTPMGIGQWSEADFVRALRTGIRPNGKTLHPTMPWQTYRQMTDDELHAIWLYLRSIPPRPFGSK
jgi:mono/diheme cytochrome c family protein